MKKAASFLLVFSFMFPGLWAEGGSDAALILSRPLGARSSGMGRAFCAVPGDTESVMYNPAGPAFLRSNSAELSYMNGFGGGNYGFGAFSFRAGGLVLTPGFLYYNSGAMNLNLSDGTKDKVTGELDKVGLFSAAYEPVKGLSLGATLKYTSIDLAETASASGLHYDFGALYDAGGGLTLGLSAMNNGQRIKFEESGDPPPSSLRAGAAFRLVLNPPNLLDRHADLSYSDLLLTADLNRTRSGEQRAHGGLEMNMTMYGALNVAVRFGYVFDSAEEGTAFGIGFKKNSWSFDFGMETSENLYYRRPVSVSYEF